MPFTVFSGEATHTVAFCDAKSWRVVVKCSNGHEGGWSTHELVASFPAGATLGEIGARLKCRTCGSTDGRLDLRQDHTAAGRRNLDRYTDDLRSGRKR